MSKLISFDPAIQDKLFRRQQIASRETPQTGEPVTGGAGPEVFAKTTWLKMSSLLIDGPILMGGELINEYHPQGGFLRFGLEGDPFASLYGTTINFAKHAESLGATGEEVSSIADLEKAFERAKKSKKTYEIGRAHV